MADRRNGLVSGARPRGRLHESATGDGECLATGNSLGWFRLPVSSTRLRQRSERGGASLHRRQLRRRGARRMWDHVRAWGSVRQCRGSRHSTRQPRASARGCHSLHRGASAARKGLGPDGSRVEEPASSGRGRGSGATLRGSHGRQKLGQLAARAARRNGPARETERRARFGRTEWTNDVEATAAVMRYGY